MKLIIFIFCILLLTNVFSNICKYSEFTNSNVNTYFQQDTTKQKSTRRQIIPYYEGKQDYIEAMFPGGKKALDKFIELKRDTNIKVPYLYIDEYPDLLPDANISFIVSKKGNLSDFKIYGKVYGCPECDVEALRIAKLMPNWLPAHKIDTNTNAVIKYYSEERVISVKFKYATK